MADVLHGGSMVAGVEVRVLNRERHAITATPTEYGVESGKSIADHIKLNPKVVDITFSMTNTDRGVELARDVAQQFDQMITARAPLTLETEHMRYSNMAPIGFYPDHASPFKGAYTAMVRLAQIGIIGGSNTSGVAGGRSAGILSGGGVSKTACGFSDGGDCRPNTDRATVSACQAAVGN